MSKQGPPSGTVRPFDWCGADGMGGYGLLAVATLNGGGAELHWVHSNHLGAPILTTDTTGTQIAPGLYAQAVFPGQLRTLPDLYYNRYRDYDSTTGRYVQADPIGLAGDDNPYLYARGNPVRYVDPLGLETYWEHYTGLPDSYRKNAINVIAGWSDTYTFGVTYGIRELIGANRDVEFCDPYYAGGAAAGLISPRGILKKLGPAGPVFGRSRYRNGNPGRYNRGDRLRVGWSWNKNGWAGPRNYFGAHGGKPGTPDHWHVTPIPGPRKP